MNTIYPAPLQLNAAGIPYSARFDDIYHSSDGGLGQTQTVFIAGNGLPQRWQGRETFTIIETGFGQGLNFLATWQAWHNDPARSARLHFVSVEQYPFSRDDLIRLHTSYAPLAHYAKQLHAAWPMLTSGFHRLAFDSGRVILTLLFGRAEALLPELDARADAIYLDGFSPAKNPDLWSPRIFSQLWRLSHAETTLATYSVAGNVRRGLNEAGFIVEKVAGYGSKGSMLRGHIARAPRRASVYAGERKAIVIGAGIAGCAIAERLAVRDWQITLLEAADTPATGASGNHVGLMHAYCSLDDNPLARLSRAGCAATLQNLHTLRTAGADIGYAVDGILQIAKNTEQAVQMAKLAAKGNWPAELVQYLDEDAASARLGQRLTQGGWWFASGAWINPASACLAWLHAGGKRIQAQYHAKVSKLVRTADGNWQAWNGQNQLLAEAPIVVFANATAARDIEQAAVLPMWDSWRVTSKIADSPALPRHSLAGSAYLTAAYLSERIIGATSYTDDLAAAVAHHRIELSALAPDLPDNQLEPLSSRICKRPSTPDRLPLIGAIPEPWHPAMLACHQPRQLPRQTGLYAALGYGPRGLSWSVLAGELIASELSGEPLPIERKLVHALDPGRFLLRALRRGQPYSAQYE